MRPGCASSASMGSLRKHLLWRVWRLSCRAGLVARRVGRGLVLLHFIVNKAARETRGRTDAGAQSGIARNSADDCTAATAPARISLFIAPSVFRWLPADRDTFPPSR